MRYHVWKRWRHLNLYGFVTKTLLCQRKPLRSWCIAHDCQEMHIPQIDQQRKVVYLLASILKVFAWFIHSMSALHYCLEFGSNKSFDQLRTQFIPIKPINHKTPIETCSPLWPVPTNQIVLIMGREMKKAKFVNLMVNYSNSQQHKMF
jgi:hypothetical protein